MNSIGCRRDTEKGAGHVERHAVNGTRIGAAAELVELLTRGYRENSDDSSRLACRGEQGSVIVECNTRQRRTVSLHDINDLKR